MKLQQIKRSKHKGIIISLFLMAVFSISSVSALAKLDTAASTDIELTPTHRVAPKYPLKAFQEKLTGMVKLSFIVGTDGRVKEVEVVDSVPAKVFDKVAIQAMEQWTFEPIEKATKTSQTLEFKLD